MKIKSLLLGSAAVMIAVSGAQAADAIVIEAEPMEYVKVCDMYGAGFFYIPGTETCININGYVRSTYIHGEENYKYSFKSFSTEGGERASTTFGGGYKYTENTSSWTVRGRLNFDVRNETEYGTLRSELRLQGGDADASGDQNVAIDRALIHLAGFRLGYSDTYWTTNHGYGAGSPAINDGLYNYDQAIFFDYTAKLMDGVSVTVGVQDSNGGSTGASSPDLYVGMNATFGSLTVAATAMRDDVVAGKMMRRPSRPIDDGDEWAYKVSAIMGLGDSGWQVGGWYMKDDGGTQYVTGYRSTGIDQQWGVQVNGALSSNMSVYGLYSEAEGAAGEWDSTELTQWAVGAVWAPVSGLTVQFEYSANDEESRYSDLFNETKDTYDIDRFAIRVTRSF